MSSIAKFLKLHTGAKIPQMGLGTLTSGQKQVFTQAVIENGFRHVDTAAYHKNENILGNAFDEIHQNGIKREDLFLTTKVWQSDYEDPVKALQGSLKKLNQDHVDLYYVHWPFNVVDPTTKVFKKIPMYKVWEKMEQCVEKGLAKHIGVCNFNVQSLVDMLSYAKIKPACCQVELHPHMPQHELVQFLKTNDIVPVAHSPLSAPNRGKMFKECGTIFEDPTMIGIAEKHGKTVAQISLAWNMARGVVVIPKTQKIKRFEENFSAQQIELDKEDIEKINSIEKRVRVYNPINWPHMNNIPIFN